MFLNNIMTIKCSKTELHVTPAALTLCIAEAGLKVPLL